ncbi:MAG TPA: pyrimidine dimer DNA glycosylase/endonuclease V [archaeon]|nr:pyrimidine dimer DNA glycosylase/endonuclease V [archaeon]
MQIFILDKGPIKAAKMLCDKHVVKMIVESAQILSTVHHLFDSKHKHLVYKKTHERHPCVIWAGTSKQNYLWLLEHLHALIEEYEYRYNKKHKTTEIKKILENYPKNIPDIGLTPFAQAIPEEYRQKNAVKAYREFYKKEKSHFAKWTKRESPIWFLE